MRHRLILLVSALGLAFSGATLPLTAAHAATGTFDTVDASVDGEVSGTFTSDAGRVRVELVGADGKISDDPTYAPVPGEPVSFAADALVLEPGTTATLKLTACDDNWTNCTVTDERSVTLADAGPVTVSAALAHPSPIVAAEHPESSIRVTVGNTENRVGHLRMFVTWLDPVGHVDYWDTHAELPQPTSTYDAVFMPKHMSSGLHQLRLTVVGPRPGTTTTREFEVEVVNPAPKIASFTRSSSTIYPAKDGYRDTVRFRTRPAVFDDADEVTLQIEDGEVDGIVRTLEPVSASATDGYLFEWDGKHDDGNTLWAGPFRAVVTLRDSVARAPEETAALSVDVVRKHLATRTWTKTVTPRASFVQQFVGRCSTIRRPSLRGWTGSFGLYSNTKCRSGWNPSWTESQHALVVAKPSNLHRYLDVRVSEYGGAATSRPRSSLGVMYASTAGEWGGRTVHGPTLGIHHGATAPASTFLHDRSTTQPFVFWNAYTYEGRRYDVKSFTVRVRYEALVND
ncbi:hypothetical protein [Nocardioides sp.]|uniref:hypothetical protein n=1 Tax=Nocardioides sp. TaxID=35761 RepID=UPI002D0613D7|nr:hypothetical protein [Nocardioides sp.]HSX66215.1 hypothetical protein [Nocardioides sp.]